MGTFNLQPEMVHTMAKIILLVFLVAYLLYSLLVVRQVSVMNKVLTTVDSANIRLLGLVQLILSLVVLLLIATLF